MYCELKPNSSGVVMENKKDQVNPTRRKGRREASRVGAWGLACTEMCSSLRALHPGTPHASTLGIAAGVLWREVCGHWVLVVVLQAGKELLDNLGMLHGQIMFFFWVLIDIKQPKSLGWWVRWSYFRNVGLRWRWKPVTTAWVACEEFPISVSNSSMDRCIKGGIF